MRQILALGIALVAVAACSDLTTLTQSNPGSLDPGTVYTPTNANLVVNGAISDFECAFTRYVVGSAVFTDELANAISASANYDYDRRTLLTNADYGTGSCSSGNQRPAIYTTLSVARRSADTAVARLQSWTDDQMPAGTNRTKLIGQANAYAGYSLILLGEGMCSAAINLGPELTPAQLFAEAKTRFDAAITAAGTASDAQTRNFATLGRARARLDLGDVAGAGTDAATIPAGFVQNTSMDAVNVRRENFSYIFINQSSFGTVDPSFRGLTVDGAPDPRVAVTSLGKNGTAPSSPLYTPDKYSSLSTPMPVARYAEAQLIIAEAKLAANDIAGATTAINNARATHTGLAPFSSAGLSASQLKNQIIEERRRELFLEGHRLGDLRRFGLDFQPASGTAYAGGGAYGTQTCFPLPDVERINNPNIGKQ